jgi:hypothetical protein
MTEKEFTWAGDENRHRVVEDMTYPEIEED